MKTWGSQQSRERTKLRERNSSRIAGRVVETRPFCRSEARLWWQQNRFPNFRTSKIHQTWSTNLWIIGFGFVGIVSWFPFGMVFRGFSAVRLVFQAPPVHEHRFQSDKLRRKGPRDRWAGWLYQLAQCTNQNIQKGTILKYGFATDSHNGKS